MRRVWLTLGMVVCVITVLAIGTVGGALWLENQDPFCAACHSEPETTYYQQSIQTNPGTLAAYHTHEKINCIDCHSGAGTWGRASGLQQGAHDLLAFVSGTYRRPAIATNPLGDVACLKCHERTANSSRVGSVAMNGHYHTYLPVWQSLDAQAAKCGTCHPSHMQGLEGLKFMSQGRVGQLCENCHVALGGKIKK